VTAADFLRAIAEEPTRADRWRVFADWLEEAGRADMAYACRWAARTRTRPLHCPGGGMWRWQWLCQHAAKTQRVPRRPKSWCAVLPRAVFNCLPRARANPGQSVGYRTLAAALRDLAAALASLREMVRV
jgi:uncharacterized protein (TIGR02996 family)